MKRAHRRLHLIVWIVMAPLTAAGLVLALLRAPADATGAIPAAAITEGGR